MAVSDCSFQPGVVRWCPNIIRHFDPEPKRPQVGSDDQSHTWATCGGVCLLASRYRSFMSYFTFSKAAQWPRLEPLAGRFWPPGLNFDTPALQSFSKVEINEWGNKGAILDTIRAQKMLKRTAGLSVSLTENPPQQLLILLNNDDAYVSIY